MPRFSSRLGNTIIPDGDNQARVSQFDGQRFLLGRNDSTTVDGAPVLTFANDRVSFVNRGEASTTGDTSTVSIEGNRGTLSNARSAEISAEDTGVSISGQNATIRNLGTIEGGVNGVNFVNGGESSGSLVNSGTISSDSRAVNIGGDGIRVTNNGDIIGTGDQRNGTVYSDGTADNFSIFNGRRATIDAGEGNNGAGVALQTGDVPGDVVNASLSNFGDIVGRGQAAANVGQAGDGVRIFAGADDVTFQGNIFNAGSITSESLQGPTAGLRVANGVNFDGTITNSRSGLIDGANNGLYFGTGDHDANVRNLGTIQSDSRAVNIDGSGVNLNNFGNIFGTGDQRNGTVYADSTADDYNILNARRGVIDAGEGNNGSGVSLQTGDVDGDEVSANVSNSGTIRGRGDAVEGNQVGDGVRIFSTVEDATFDGNIVNRGNIIASEDSDAAVGISIEDGVSFDGRIVNSGSIEANETAIDATEAGGRVVIQNVGRIDGDVNLSDGNDVFSGVRGRVNGTIDGGAGDDNISSGVADDVLVGGLGNDVLNGGRGNDTASFADADVPVDVNLARGVATRETGFTVEVDDQPLASLTTAQSPQELVEEAANGNLYYNIHTNDFNGGEIRGQLLVASDSTENGVRTLVLEASLDAAQEPGPLSDSDATGQGTVTIVVDGDNVSYSSTLSVTGLATSDLLPVAGVSSIHIHNAPAGQNGPVIADFIQDAGGDVTGAVAPGAIGDTGDGNVFVEAVETDRLISIENVIGSNDGDTITGNSGANTLTGLEGDDILTGGQGNDTFVFLSSDSSDNDTVTDFQNGRDLLDVSGFGFLDIGDVDVQQVGADTVLSLDANNTVTLNNVNANLIDDQDFIF